VIITDHLPLGVTGVISTYSAPITAMPGLTYTWQVAELDVGESGVITLSGVLGMGLAGGHTLTNVATITSTMVDTNTADNGYTTSITVLNAAPVAHDSSGIGFITDENSAFLTASVLNDGSDPNGDPIVVDSINTGDTLGLVSNHSDGSFGYDPNGQFAHLTAGERAFDTFVYTISDGVLSDTATVTITVNGLNTPPLAVGDAYVTAFETPLNVPAATGVLLNDFDADSALLTVTLDSPPSNGALAFEVDGSFTYTPSNGFAGPDSFTYLANDGLAGSNVATVTINVLYSTGADLEMRKDVNDPTPGEGDAIVYTLQVTNHGPADATNVTASDLLPLGLSYVAADGDYDPASGTWSVGNLHASASTSLRITATVNGGTQGAVITNTASIGSCDQDDPLAGNDKDEAVITVAPLPTYALTVNTVGQGLVNLNPAGGVYEAGTVVTLQAVPAPGWGLAGWSDGLGSAEQVTVTVDGDKTITATFEQVTFSLYLPLAVTSSS
ncbi:MAG: Ig-like domain-containing protein, partial [Anaerolineae bacterium]|jgi:uncharacterized repeat protein (TIGR01451 family)